MESKKKRLTQARLKELMDYDPVTGVFVRRIGVQSVRMKTVGKEINHKTPQGYLMCSVDGNTHYCHRLAWLYVYGFFPENNLDHINRVGSDNRIENLREVSQQCNVRNRGQLKNNTSGVTGVYWRKQAAKWMVYITVNRKTHHLGCYKSKDNAVSARLAAEQCLGWAGCDSNSPAYQYVKNMIRAA